MEQENDQIEYFVNKAFMKGMNTLDDQELKDWLSLPELTCNDQRIAFERIRTNEQSVTIVKNNIVKQILDEMVAGKFIGDEADLIDNFENKLANITTCDKEVEKLSAVICNLYEFIK